MISICQWLCGGGNTCVETRDPNLFAHIDHFIGFVHAVPSHIGYNLLSNTGILQILKNIISCMENVKPENGVILLPYL